VLPLLTVMPQARNNRDSYMFDRGKWPLSTHRAASNEANAKFPPSIAACSTFPARFSSVKNACHECRGEVGCERGDWKWDDFND
jgi:hypothetical protein